VDDRQEETVVEVVEVAETEEKVGDDAEVMTPKP